jgi:hypothetical protein
VARSGPSAADRQLLAAVTAAGHRVSLAQLERWRHAGLVPRNERHGLGRGRGSTSLVPDGAVDAVVKIAAQARQGRQVDFTDVLTRAAMGEPTPAGWVKAELLRQFRAAITQLAADVRTRDADQGGDIRFGAARRAVGTRTHPGTGQWLQQLLTTGQEPPMPRPKQAREAMAEMLQNLASAGEDVSTERLVNAAKVLGMTDSGDPEVDAVWDLLETGQLQLEDIEGLDEAWSMPRMLERLSDVGESEMIRALQAVMLAQGTQTGLLFFALPRLGNEPDLVPAELAHWADPAVLGAMFADPIWKLWGRHNTRVSMQERLRPAALTITATMALLTEQVEDIEAYGQRLIGYLYGQSAPPGPTAPSPKAG